MFNIHYVSVAIAMVYTPDLGYIKLDFLKGVFEGVTDSTQADTPLLEKCKFWFWFWFLTAQTPIENIHFTDAWSQTKEVIPVVFPIQSI